LHYFPGKAGTDRHDVLQVFRRTGCMRGENSGRYVRGSEYSPLRRRLLTCYFWHTPANGGRRQPIAYTCNVGCISSRRVRKPSDIMSSYGVYSNDTGTYFHIRTYCMPECRVFISYRIQIVKSDGNPARLA